MKSVPTHAGVRECKGYKHCLHPCGYQPGDRAIGTATTWHVLMISEVILFTTAWYLCARFDRTAYSVKCPPFRSSSLGDLANSRKAVSIACRRVCPVIIVIHERSAAAAGDNHACSLIDTVPQGPFIARSRYRRCRSAVVIAAMFLPFGFSVTALAARWFTGRLTASAG